MPAVDESPWATLNGRWTATAATGLTAFVNAGHKMINRKKEAHIESKICSRANEHQICG
jgi:hypothetical protein